MTGTLLLLTTVFLILGITIYSYFKYGSGNYMKNIEVVDRLQTFIGTDVNDSIQNQFEELIEVVFTSIKAVNKNYEPAVYILNSDMDNFTIQKHSSENFKERIAQNLKLSLKILLTDGSEIFKQNEFSKCFNELFGEVKWSGSECIIGTRITYKDQPIGFLLVFIDHFSKIQKRDKNIIRYNGEFITLGMTKIDKIESLITDNHYNTHVTKLYKSVDMYSKEEEIYDEVEGLCHRFFTYDKLSISFLVDEEKAQLKCVDGIKDDINLGTEFSIHDSLHGRCVLRDEVIRTTKWKQDYNEKYRFNEGSDKEYKFLSVLVSPVYLKDGAAGTIGIERLTSKPFNDSDQKLLGLIASTLGYILSWLKEFKKIHDSSIHDGLTGVLNRKAFDVRLKEEINRASRTNQSLCLIMFDLDKFKRINDTYGHPYGDYVIQKTAQLLKNSVRNIDVVARYGGEEFMVILVDTDKEKTIHVAKRMVENIAEFPFEFNDVKERITISAGMAEFPEDSDNDDSLIQLSDEAMYDSKKKGGNLVTIYDASPGIRT